MDERAAALNAFLQSYLQNQADGHSHPLAHYVDLFPDQASAVEAEYARLQRGEVLEERREHRIGPYRTVRELGRGGQGVVYLAEDTRMGRRVALKVLGTLAGFGGERQERFLREARVTARLDDPGICTVFETGEDAGCAWISMGYVEGRSLAALIRDARDDRADADTSAGVGLRSREGVRQVARLALQLARTLARAHGMGVVHRDVKPGNVMVTADGRPVLLDFGLARDASGDGPTLTATSHQPGTRSYMSPEQASGSAHADARSDVWSLGVTLYEALTLQRPFQAASEDELKDRIRFRTPSPLARANPAAPKILQTIVSVALQKSPSRRYASMAAFADDLQAFLDDRPITARPPTPFTRLALATRRHASLVLVAATLLLVVLGATLIIATSKADLAEQRRTELVDAALAELERINRVLPDADFPELELPGLLRSVWALTGHAQGLGRTLDAATFFSERHDMSVAAHLAGQVLDASPPPPIEARARLLRAMSLLHAGDNEAAGREAHTARTLGADVLRCDAVITATRILGRSRQLPLEGLRSMTSWRNPGDDRDTLIAVRGTGETDAFELVTWRFPDAVFRHLRVVVPGADHGPLDPPMLSALELGHEPRLVIGTTSNVGADHRSLLLTLPWPPDASGRPLVARVANRNLLKPSLLLQVPAPHGGAPSYIVRHGRSRKLALLRRLDDRNAIDITPKHAGGLEDSDVLGLVIHDLDRDGTPELLAGLGGHRLVGLFSASLDAVSRAGQDPVVWKRHVTDPITGLTSCGERLFASKGFRPARRGVPQVRGLPAGTGIHEVLSDLRLAPAQWTAPEALGLEAGVARPSCGKGAGQPFLIGRVMTPRRTVAGARTFVTEPILLPCIGSTGESAPALLIGCQQPQDVVMTVDLDGDGDDEIVLQGPVAADPTSNRAGITILGLSSGDALQTGQDVADQLIPLAEAVAGRRADAIMKEATVMFRDLVRQGAVPFVRRLLQDWIAALPRDPALTLWRSRCAGDLTLLEGESINADARDCGGFLQEDVCEALRRRQQQKPSVLLAEDFDGDWSGFRPSSILSGGSVTLGNDPLGLLGASYDQGPFLVIEIRDPPTARKAGSPQSTRDSEFTIVEALLPRTVALTDPLRLHARLFVKSLSWSSNVGISLEAAPGNGVSSSRGGSLSFTVTHGRNFQICQGDVREANLTLARPGRESLSQSFRIPNPVQQWLALDITTIPELGLVRVELREDNQPRTHPPLLLAFAEFGNEALVFDRLHLITQRCESDQTAPSMPGIPQGQVVRAFFDDVTLSTWR